MSRVALLRPAGWRAAGRAALLALAVCGVWGSLDGMAIAQDSAQATFVEAGRKLATERCGRCHALALEGASPHPKAPPFRLVVERYPSENLAEALAEGIVAGHPDMPVIVLEPREIEAFLAWLNSLGRVGK